MIKLKDGYKSTPIGLLPVDWEVKKLGELLEFKNGINASKEQYGLGVKFINVLDILNNEYITFDKIIGKVDIDQITLSKYAVNYGDILFQRSSETREEVGTANVYLDNNSEVTFGGFVIRGKKIKDYFPIFVNKVLKNSIVRNQITSKAGGSTRYNVSQEILEDVLIPFPAIQEQEKISQVLMTWDEAIEKQEQLIEQEKEFKKGMMQKIFSRELRFEDENRDNYPEWEYKKLGLLCNINTGKLDANAMIKNGKYRFYTCAREHYYINNFAFDTDALLISGNGANVGYIHHYKGKFNAYQRTYVLDNFKENIIFIKYILNKDLKKRIKQEKNQGNTPYIVLETLTGMKLNIPSLPEQEKIANLFSTIDEKLEVLEQKLVELKEQKKGLMQKLLTGEVRV